LTEHIDEQVDTTNQNVQAQLSDVERRMQERGR